jgi:hypothetical protein
MALKMSSVPIPKVVLGKHKQRSIMTKKYTHDGQIVYPEMDVLGSHCQDEVNAYILDASEQLRGEDGNWYQILDESSCIPRCIRHPEKYKDLWNIVKQIHHASRRSAILAQFTKANKNSRQDFILKVIAIPCSIGGLIYLITLWRG